jgi:hypothetical protein
LKGPVLDAPGTLEYQNAPAKSIADPLKRVGIARKIAIERRMGPPVPQTSEAAAV